MGSFNTLLKAVRFVPGRINIVFLWVLISTFLIFTFQYAEAQPPQHGDSFFERGLQKKEAEAYDEALAIWHNAKEELSEPDFRISQAYLKLVSKKELEDYYTTASELYMWGLDGSIDPDERDLLLEEIEYLMPLLDRRDYKDIKESIKNRDTSALQKIRSFWKAVDPTPLTEYNERLIEHQQRLEYVKKHYTKKNSDELDDRAHIYLKYGEPFYSKEGRLNYTSSMVSRLLQQGIQNPSFANQDQMALTASQRITLENRVRQYHHYNRYEVWIYRDLNRENKRQNIVFMFGTRDGNSSFRRIDSIDDFIPSEAYRTYMQHNYSIGNAGRTGSSTREDRERERESVMANAQGPSSGTRQIDITPALILQLMYYQQFAALDSYFGSAFDQMMNRYISVSNSVNNTFDGLAREFGTLYGNKLIVIQSKAPTEKTGLYDKIMELPTQVYTYRFLDDSGEPYSKMFCRITFNEAARYDMLKETNSLETVTAGRYKLLSGYKLQDDSGNTIGSRDKENEIASMDPFTSTFDIPQPERLKKVIVSHELHRTASENIRQKVSSSDNPFPASLKGLKNMEVDLKDPLVNDGKLLLSDLILGYSYNSAENPASKRDSLNFTIAHNKAIPRGSDLSFYYELYNIQPAGTEQVSEYSFEYSISRKKKGLFGGRKDALISVDIMNTVIGKSDKNVITIDTSQHEEGDYVIEILISDLNSGSVYATTEEFSIR